MKKEMKVYRAFLEEVVKDKNCLEDGEEINIKDAIPILHQFCKNELSAKQLRGIFQLPRSELTEELKSKYKICSAYAIVFCGVVEQVANFKLTGYGVDARCGSEDDRAEEIFENELQFKKVGPGFCLNITTNNGDDEWEVNDDVLLKFLQRVVSLAGPMLLARAAKTSHDNNDGGSGSDNNESDGGEEKNATTPSFRSDRRVVRLLIARYWADRLIEKYRDAQKKKKEEEQTIENTDVVQ